MSNMAGERDYPLDEQLRDARDNPALYAKRWAEFTRELYPPMPYEEDILDKLASRLAIANDTGDAGLANDLTVAIEEIKLLRGWCDE